ncbi:MAG: serine/threonine-protein kinase, partial [Clostridia bacterium]|nr:serine/threonine-protein kinase [Clostridia bacterium]
MISGKIIDGRYEIIEEIGRGGMAIVFRAKCMVLNRYVAIKMLRPEYRNDLEFIKRFKIEAQSAGSLSHP